MATKPVNVSPERLASAMASGVFDPEEASAFLRFPSVLCFNRARQRHKIAGVRFGRSSRYSRETLDAMRKIMFGLDGPAERKGKAK